MSPAARTLRALLVAGLVAGFALAWGPEGFWACVPGALRDRLHLIRHAMETLFGGRPSFNACWTYITARKPSTRGQTPG